MFPPKENILLWLILTFVFRQWTFWYFLYCDTQETFDFSSLVPPYYSSTLLLAFVCNKVPTGYILRCHELLCSCNHVWVLLFDGNETSPQVVQSNDYHGLSDLSNGCRCGCYRSWILLLQDRWEVPNWKRKQHCSLCHVWKLSLFVLTILRWPLFQTKSLSEKAKISIIPFLIS